MTTATLELPTKLKEAMEAYWDNKAAQHLPPVCVSEFADEPGPQQTTKWDKMADLDHIADVCKELGFGLEACTGTFWISWYELGIVTRHDGVKHHHCRFITHRKVDGVWKKLDVECGQYD